MSSTLALVVLPAILLSLCGAVPVPDMDASTSNSYPIEAFRETALYAHNAKRALHGSPPLRLNPALNDHAQALADRMAAGDYSPVYTAYNGNNIYWSGAVPITITGEDPVNTWYAELDKFDYNDPWTSTVNNATNFAHLVWKRSTELGVGVSRCTRGTNYAIAVYDPAPIGDTLEDFQQNVPRRL